MYDGNLPHPFALTVFEDTVYWTDWNTRTVEKGNKYDGSDREALVNTTHRPFDIHVYHPYRQPIGESSQALLSSLAGLYLLSCCQLTLFVCGPCFDSKQSLCCEQWGLLSPVPNPSRGARTHLWLPRPFPGCSNRRCDPMPAHVHQHPVQMRKQWTVCHHFFNTQQFFMSVVALKIPEVLYQTEWETTKQKLLF